MNKTANKWKTCPKAKNNMLYGIISILSGCVLYWHLRKNKYIRRLNDMTGFLTNDQLNAAALVSNVVLKPVGIGLCIKGLIDYSEC